MASVLFTALCSYLRLLGTVCGISTCIALLLHIRAMYLLKKHKRSIYDHCESALYVTVLVEDIVKRKAAYRSDIRLLGLDQTYHVPDWTHMPALTDQTSFLISHTKLSELPTDQCLHTLRRLLNYRYARHLLNCRLQKLKREVLSLLPPTVRAFADTSRLPSMICGIRMQELSLPEGCLRFVFDDGSCIQVPLTRKLLSDILCNMKEDIHGA